VDQEKLKSEVKFKLNALDVPAVIERFAQKLHAGDFKDFKKVTSFQMDLEGDDVLTWRLLDYIGKGQRQRPDVIVQYPAANSADARQYIEQMKKLEYNKDLKIYAFDDDTSQNGHPVEHFWKDQNRRKAVRRDS
jgi:hypothetical protein